MKHKYIQVNVPSIVTILNIDIVVYINIYKNVQ